MKTAPVREGRMGHASTMRRLIAGAAALLRLAALTSFALISTGGLSRAKDRCADTAEAAQGLQEGDQYQTATLLFAAARLGCEAEARALLDRGAAIDAQDREGKTALAKAAEADKLPLIRLLLERGANANVRAVDGSAPLLYAAE
ncbi:MAG TPA: ankyrin repeat domain-containing protein, partial [Roseiarcus sp.]